MWTSEVEQPFSVIKTSLTSAPGMVIPDFFGIQFDAGDSRMGEILYQECEEAEHPIAYASKSLTKNQKLYRRN